MSKFKENLIALVCAIALAGAVYMVLVLREALK